MAMGTGHGGRQPLEKQRGLETKTAAAGSSAAEAKKPRRVWPAALMACFLAVTAVLLLQRWRTDASPEWLYQVERPAEDIRGASRVHYFIPVFVSARIKTHLSVVYAHSATATWWSGSSFKMFNHHVEVN